MHSTTYWLLFLGTTDAWRALTPEVKVHSCAGVRLAAEGEQRGRDA